MTSEGRGVRAAARSAAGKAVFRREGLADLYPFKAAGGVEIKGKGRIATWRLEGRPS